MSMTGTDASALTPRPRTAAPTALGRTYAGCGVMIPMGHNLAEMQSGHSCFFVARKSRCLALHFQLAFTAHGYALCRERKTNYQG